MKYIVDAQLPKRLSRWLNANSYDSIHTLDLPDKNDTEDIEIQDSVVVSKDKDFPDYRFIKGLPQRLLWVTTGNIVNKELISLFERGFSKIDSEFKDGRLFIELSNESIIIHE